MTALERAFRSPSDDLKTAWSREASSDGVTARGPLGRSRPVYFLHIAKTGGTSLTDAIARLYPPGLVFTDPAGNVTIDYLRGLGARLEGRAFLAGHAGPGVATFLSGRADVITLLRRPADQAVSNYLHILSDPENALHAEALSGSFSDYLQRNDHQIDYQTTSLAGALTADPERLAALRDNPDQVTQFLEGLPFVGVVERVEACGEVLSRLFPDGGSIALACLNAAVYRGISIRTLERLRKEYEDLRGDQRLAPIFAREAQVHATAETALRRLERSLAIPRRGPRSHAPAILNATRFRSVSGFQAGSAIIAALPNASGHVVHGPFDVLPKGRYDVAFHFTVQDAGPQNTGRIELEVFSNGAVSLRRRWLAAGGWNSARARSLAFDNPANTNVLEFRIRAEGFDEGCLIFEGVTLRLSDLRRAWPSFFSRIFSGLRNRGRSLAASWTAARR